MSSFFVGSSGWLVIVDPFRRGPGAGSGRRSGGKNKFHIDRNKESKTFGQYVDAEGNARPEDYAPGYVKKGKHTGALPDELPDDWTAGASKSNDDAVANEPFARSSGDEGDELAWLDDPSLGNDVAVPEKPAKKSTIKKSAGHEDFGDDDEDDGFGGEPQAAVVADKFPDCSQKYYDLEDKDPDALETIESDLGASKMRGARFNLEDPDTTYMELADGERWKHNKAAGWLKLHDGSSPTGEF